MSIFDTGFLSYHNNKCAYVQEDMDYILTPVNDNSNILKYDEKKNYKISFCSPSKEACIISVKEHIPEVLNLHGVVRLKLNYITKKLSENEIDGFIMEGKEIDEFFSPIEYFYRMKHSEKAVSCNYLYEKETVKRYQFKFNKKPVTVDLNYGNILSEGLASDATLHAKLYIHIERTTDTDYIFQVSEIIKKFLQFVLRKTTLNLKPFKLFHLTSENKTSILGFMISSIYHPESRANNGINATFLEYGEKLNNLLSIIASEEDFPTQFLETTDVCEYSSKNVGMLSSAFEYEYRKGNIYEKKSSMNDLNVKTDLLNYINTYTPKNELEKNYIGIVRDKVSKIGSEIGLTQRIINAFIGNKNILNSLFDLKKEPDLNNFVKKTAKMFVGVRGKTVHDKPDYLLNNKEQKSIRLIEILRFVMVLRRADYIDKEIEQIIGLVFWCNNSLLNSSNAQE